MRGGVKHAHRSDHLWDSSWHGIAFLPSHCLQDFHDQAHLGLQMVYFNLQCFLISLKFFLVI